MTLKAETAYQIIQALSESELSRLYIMLDIKPNSLIKQPNSKKKGIIRDAEAIEYLLKMFEKRRKSNKLKE